MKKAFTLIELLIVVAIIGILAVALIPAITSGPARARDAARITAVNDVISAVEQYNLDEGEYPQRAISADATGCLDFTQTDLGTAASADLRSYFGKIPSVEAASVELPAYLLCSENDEFIFYRTQNSGGGAITGANYVVAVQVERQESANVLRSGGGQPSVTTVRGANGVGFWGSKSAIQDDIGPDAPTATYYMYAVVK
jgi:prepilin-type N-terminal cleavage/methylation domain-containing protein